MQKFWEFVVRFRNWLVTLIGALIIILPDLLQAPELIAVLPEAWRKWVFLAVLLLNLALRWRPAAMWHDPEVRYARAARDADLYEGENV
jgi:hypothetical protein